MVRLTISDFIEYLRDDPCRLDFEAGWLLHLPTGARCYVDPKGGFTIHHPRFPTSLVTGPEHASEFEALFRTWYDGYWRPKKIDEALERYRAPSNAIGHLLRRVGWRRALHVPPTADELLGLSCRITAVSVDGTLSVQGEVMAADLKIASAPLRHSPPHPA